MTQCPPHEIALVYGCDVPVPAVSVPVLNDHRDVVILGLWLAFALILSWKARDRLALCRKDEGTRRIDQWD